MALHGLPSAANNKKGTQQGVPTAIFTAITKHLLVMHVRRADRLWLAAWLPGNVSSYHRPTTSSIPPTCEFANKPGTRRHRGSMQNIPAAGTLFVASMPINQLEGHFLVCLSSLTHTQTHKHITRPIKFNRTMLWYPGQAPSHTM